MATTSSRGLRLSQDAQATLNELLAFAKTLAGVTIEEKKTCLHVVAGNSAFLGVHPRRSGLRLTLVLNRPLEGARIVKCLQASKRRYYVDLNVLAKAGLDDELRGWIAEAHGLKTAVRSDLER